MKLSSLLNPEFIVYGIEGSNRFDIYKRLVKKISHEIKLPEDVEHIVTKLLEREDSIQIPYEKGFAFPHLRIEGINDLYIAIGILDKPVKLKSNDISKTRIVLTFLISENTSHIYLKVLSTFARYFLGPGNLDKLANTADSSQFLKLLDADNVEIKRTLLAEDIMATDFPFVMENDPISKAFDIFTSEQKSFLPVLNNSQEFLGVIEASEIVSKYFPGYMLLLDNSKIFKSFEPLDSLLRAENTSLVKEYISFSDKIESPGTPAVQLILTLLQEGVTKIFIVENKKLVGLVSMQEVIRKIIRG